MTGESRSEEGDKDELTKYLKVNVLGWLEGLFKAGKGLTNPLSDCCDL